MILFESFYHDLSLEITYYYVSTGKRNEYNKILNLIWKVIEILLLLIFGILAIFYSKGSIDAFSDQKTSLRHEMQPITNHPTFIMCFGLSHLLLNSWFVILELGTGFNISISIDR